MPLLAGGGFSRLGCRQRAAVATVAVVVIIAVVVAAQLAADLH
jgi:hypothetical protein